MASDLDSDVSKTSDEILLFLVKNAEADAFLPVKPPVNAELMEWYRPLHDLLLRLCGATRYQVPQKDFEAFVGEPYSFEKHIRPLHDAGHIRCSGIAKPGEFYDSPAYRKAFDHASGLVCDYSIEGRPSWIAFKFRGDDDDFLKELDAVWENADELGLVQATEHLDCSVPPPVS
jgi:hypothetical protein